MKSAVNVMMLAAGLGTRLKPLTLNYPKPCVPFLNVPMGLYQFQYLNSLEISKLVVNTFHLPEKIQQLYRKQPYYGNEVFFSNESGQILGGAGGLKKAAPLMQKDQPILMLNADEVFFTKNKDFLAKALSQHIEKNNLATIIVIEHPEAGKKFGAIWADKFQAKDISKTAKHTHLKPWHSIGLIFLSWEVLNLIPENKESNIFYDILLPKIPDSKVEIFPLEADWYETGNPTDYFDATKTVLKNISSETLDFINRYDPSDVIQNERTLSLVSKAQKRDVSQLQGVNVISKTFTAPKNNLVKDSVLFDQEVLTLDYFK